MASWADPIAPTLRRIFFATEHNLWNRNDYSLSQRIVWRLYNLLPDCILRPWTLWRVRHGTFKTTLRDWMRYMLDCWVEWDEATREVVIGTVHGKPPVRYPLGKVPGAVYDSQTWTHYACSPRTLRRIAEELKAE